MLTLNIPQGHCKLEEAKRCKKNNGKVMRKRERGFKVCSKELQVFITTTAVLVIYTDYFVTCS